MQEREINMAKRILIMGLPGAGKTTLADKLKTYLEDNSGISSAPLDKQIRIIESPKLDEYKCTVEWFNADEIRKQYNDWDFSPEGRIRQSLRMFELSKKSVSDFVICDFVAPLVEMRNNYKADWTIWIDSIKEGRYEDTNKAFTEPTVYDFRVPEQDADKWSAFIGKKIAEDDRRPIFDWKKETVQMLGRWQPWHDGHRALFERLLSKTGQVVIQIRDVQGWEGSNPFQIEQVTRFIKADLDPLYQGQYEIQVVPNIVHIGWGRGVGYTSGEETFDEAITSISATNVRKDLGVK
jgi:adenylylsulfate kinase